MLNPFHVNSQKVLQVLLIIPVVLRRCSVLKQVMQNASEHSDSTVSSEQINIPNIGVFLKAIGIYKIHVSVPMNGNQVIQVILEKKLNFIHEVEQRKRVNPDTK